MGNAWRRTNLTVLVSLVLASLVYVGNAWSPSSYGYVLGALLGTPGGPAWGTSRPIRSDEFAVVTPLTQATINNHFDRYNRTSLYGEDLRSNYGLPLHDWGIAFKPTMWLYGLANPAYAFSLHWFLLAALFFVGYAWLFRWLGATPMVGFALSASLYFTAVVQFWWNEKGSEFALFPWVILALASRLPLTWKALLFYWVSVVWLLTNFYPPVQISLAFVGLVMLFAREPALFRPRPLAVLGVVAVLAAGTAAMYLWDYLGETSTTIYPGARHVSGQTLPIRLWISWLLPTVNFDRNFESFVGANVCEIGTLGTYYTLFGLCFLDFAMWRSVWKDKDQRRAVVVLAGGLAMMIAWMTLPLPSWVGAPLLWNFVQPQRMQYASGLLSVVLLFTLISYLGLKFSIFRLAAFLLLVSYGLWTLKFVSGHGDYWDVVIVALAMTTFAIASFRPHLAHPSIAVAALCAGMVLFGRFNPLQSAFPIFEHPASPVIAALDKIAIANDGILAVTGLPGAVANGLGYRSVSHVTPVPHLDYWRKQFPEIANDEFQRLFNRYSHIIPMATPIPRLLQDDAIIVPIRSFQKDAAQVRYVSTPNRTDGMAGHIDTATFDQGQAFISGWGPWTGPPGTHELEVSISPEATGPSFGSMVLRPDLPSATNGQVAASNGFSLIIPLAEGTTQVAVCLVAYDSSTGKRLLVQNPPDLAYCQR